MGGQPVQVANAALPPPPGTSGGPINLAGGAPAGGYGAGGTVVVAQGETLEIIAMRYGVPVQDIARANGISSPAQGTPGRALVIPQAGPPVAYASAEPLPAPTQVSAGGGVIHVVDPADLSSASPIRRASACRHHGGNV
jgi:hypothetical protein